jgi:2-keto-3-deoxy-L-rhamnonate aldolase RhmA
MGTRKKKNLRQVLNNGEITVGSWITIGDTSLAEIMAMCGFEWLVVDMEHSAIDIGKAQELIRIIDLAGCCPFVRVGDNSSCLIKRAMDAGAHGVIVPMVNSKKDAEKAVSAVKYPPEGKRGVGLARAQGYGASFENYKKWVREESIVIVQIEDIRAIENLEDILSTGGVDASIIGPYDLSASLGYPGDFDRAEIKDALNKYLSVCKKLKKSAGIHVITPDSAGVDKRVQEGFKFIAFSFDAMFLGDKIRSEMKKIKGEA